MFVAQRSGTIAAVGLALGLLALPSAHAQNLLSDGSFEDTQLPPGNYEYVNGTLNGWLYSGLAVLINVADSSPWTTPELQTGYDGNQIAGVQQTGSISQTFGSPTTGVFDVSWLDNARPGYGTQEYNVSVTNASTGAVVASQNYTVSSVVDFNPEFMTADLVAGDEYMLTFQGLDPNGGDVTAFIDDVDVDGAPAPRIGALPLPLSVLFFAAFVWLHRRAMRQAA
jgi:hypothetical protein